MVVLPIPIVVTVASPVTVAVTVATPSAPAVVVTSPTLLTATVGAPSTVTATVGTPTTIAVDVLTPDVIECEVIMGITQADLDKLNSIEWGATRGQDYVKKASVAQKNVDAMADSDVWELTNTAQEIVRWPMWANEWRDSGVLDFSLTGEFLNDSGSDYTITVELQVCDMPHTTNDISDANFGLLESWTTAYSYVTENVVDGGPGSGSFMFEVAMHAEGHTGLTWTQRVRMLHTQELLPASDPQEDLLRAEVEETQINPTKDQWFRIRASMSVATGATKYVTVKSANASLRNMRDGTQS